MITKSGLDPKNFEAVVDGKKTALYCLANKQGMEVCVTNYGGTILSIMTPDRDGKFANVVLCYDSIDQCTHAPEPYLGVAIGRYGNRIANGKFSIDGTEYTLVQNNGVNSLHGGPTGFNFRVWDVVEATDTKLTLTYLSADGEEGYPGNLKVVMTYTLTEDNALQIEYKATTDKKTIVNLTNHSFFNLEGAQEVTPTVYEHVLTMNCKQYIPVQDAGAIPTGERATVEGTPFDFRTPHTIGERIDCDDEQIKFGAGYDHCYCVDLDSEDQRGMKGLKLVATVESPKTGRVLKAYTNEPGMQLYTGNFLTGFAGAHGHKFPRRAALCLESQKHPDSINQKNFESPILCPGEEYYSVCVYEFGVK
ncbi:MAG: galactose mutarotase [Bacteroidales bacterium]|nr:galactose mutarotase [Candidatus Liminaster caballi]